MIATAPARPMPNPSPSESSVKQPSYTPGIVVTRTPLRVSFAGGGTDLADFYEHEDGAVFSCAINRYVYVTVKRHSELFLEPIRVNYSTTEQVNRVDEIRNDIARECLRLLNIDPPIYVSTVADMPASTGLGGSSSFTVGLLHALHAYRGERVSASQLGEEASHIEVNVLKQPIGKQDQYAAAFGGLNIFRFQKGGRVSVEPLQVKRGKLDDLFAQMMLFFTGMTRDANSVLTEQKQNTSVQFERLRAMRAHALQLHALMRNGPIEPETVGRILHESWQMKRALASRISNQQIDEWYERARRAGAEGGKLCGAGGGGFLLLFVRPELQEQVRAALHDLTYVKIEPEVNGSQLLLPFLH